MNNKLLRDVLLLVAVLGSMIAVSCNSEKKTHFDQGDLLGGYDTHEIDSMYGKRIDSISASLGTLDTGFNPIIEHSEIKKEKKKVASHILCIPPSMQEDALDTTTTLTSLGWGNFTKDTTKIIYDYIDELPGQRDDGGYNYMYVKRQAKGYRIFSDKNGWDFLDEKKKPIPGGVVVDFIDKEWK